MYLIKWLTKVNLGQIDIITGGELPGDQNNNTWSYISLYKYNMQANEHIKHFLDHINLCIINSSHIWQVVSLNFLFPTLSATVRCKLV